MPDLNDSFDWLRDPKGRFAFDRSKRWIVRGDVQSLAREKRFVRKGSKMVAAGERVVTVGSLEMYRPVSVESLLPTAFANIREADGLLAFVNRFGPLVNGYDQKRDSLDQPIKKLLQDAKIANRLLGDAADQKTNELRDFLEDYEDWFGALLVKVRADGLARGPHLTLEPPDLLGLIKYLIGFHLSEISRSPSEARVFKRCRRCDDIFAAGPGTGRTKKAEFCSDEHRVEYNSLTRTVKKEMGYGKSQKS